MMNIKFNNYYTLNRFIVHNIYEYFLQHVQYIYIFYIGI